MTPRRDTTPSRRRVCPARAAVTAADTRLLAELHYHHQHTQEAAPASRLDRRQRPGKAATTPATLFTDITEIVAVLERAHRPQHDFIGSPLALMMRGDVSRGGDLAAAHHAGRRATPAPLHAASSCFSRQRRRPRTPPRPRSAVSSKTSRRFASPLLRHFASPHWGDACHLLDIFSAR